MRFLLRLGAVAALAWSAASCDTPVKTPDWHQETGYRWRDVVVPSHEVGFTAMPSKTTGIAFQNFVSDSVLLPNRILGQGAGVALGDVDGDGLPDVFLARTEGCNGLYKNLGNWHFQDITTASGVGACDRRNTGAAFADIDGDGDLDLVLLSTTGPNAVFVNDGHGVFAERKDLGLDSTGKGGTTIAMSDVDGDGQLDLYVANYKDYSLEDSLPPQRRAFSQMVREVAPGKFEVVPEFKHEYKVVMRPDMGGLRMTMRGNPDDFYKNDGGHFTRVPFTSERFADAAGKRLTEDPESFALDAKFVDFNGDGWPDLYVSNDFEDTDQLWLNDGHGNFRLADWRSQRQISNSAMGADVGDLNGDGIPDLFEVDMMANDSRRQKTQIPTHTALVKKPGEMDLELQQQRNTLFINRGDGTFEETGQYAGVEASGWSWSTMLMDVDLDGWQDILIANGHLWDIMDADTQERLQNRLTAVQWQKTRWEFPKLKLKNVAFRNKGNMTFEDVSQQWHFGTEDAISHTMAAADLDGDGDLDVVVNRLGSPALVLRNDASAPRVGVRLVGDKPNTHAVGSKVTLLGGAVPIQKHEVVVGGLYMSHSDYELSFAMGKSDSATLVVDWRDGRQTILKGVKPNRMYEITAATAGPRPAPSPDTLTRSSLFENATPQLGGHVHTENTFDDWDRQFLLPNALSMSGPGIAWYDLDRDGREDLLVGTGKGGQLGVFKNTNGRLAPVSSRGPTAPSDFATILGMTENGKTSVLVGISTWESRTPEQMTQQPAALAVPVTTGSLGANGLPLVGSHDGSTGPMALADYDGDGDLDLFIGSRAIAMRYPVAASSGLFKNDGGKYVVDTDNSVLLRDAGLVSSAVFADVNGDGFPDLLLAREWDSILLLLNDGHGRFSRAPDSWGLSKWSSRWIGLAAGDVDGDGRLDIVATSWGRNTAVHADSANPLLLYHGAFGARGEEEMLLAQRDPRINAIAPLNPYARVRVAMPDLVSRVPTFAAYADATIDQVLGPAMSKVLTLKATTLDQMVFLNRGDHFEARPLPMEAQLAPASYVGIADFDGDGNEDVFLTQNFFPTDIGTPRYDAGRSLLLLGNGTGAFKAATGAESGLIVYGDQRGAAYADYDDDGRLDLAVSQNGAATMLFHNRGAKPGLRVRVEGPATNPDGVGAQLRVVYGDKMGPVQEVEAGSGYWSQNGAVQVFGLSGTPTAVWVRWPGGAESRTSVPAGTREVVIKR